jgi:hypothetical protein
MGQTPNALRAKGIEEEEEMTVRSGMKRTVTKAVVTYFNAALSQCTFLRLFITTKNLSLARGWMVHEYK